MSYSFIYYFQLLSLQDISFFDSETVGGLTSRLGSDCQQVSRVMGNDLNLIFRNVLQVRSLNKFQARFPVLKFRILLPYPIGNRCFGVLVDFVTSTWILYIGHLCHSLNHHGYIWPVRFFRSYSIYRSDYTLPNFSLPCLKCRQISELVDYCHLEKHEFLEQSPFTWIFYHLCMD